MLYSKSNHTILGLLSVSLPLILSIFGWTLMITVDRVMIAQFDIEAMNGVVAIGTLLMTFEMAIGTIAITSEIFSGQYNGLKRKEMVPVASWQMLILSFVCSIIYIPAGLFLGPYIIPYQYYEKVSDFYTIIMCFLFLSPAIGAINGFFIGIKKTYILLINTVFSNIINIVLSYFFIFGIKDIIEPMGTKGAAIATTISLVIQFIVIFSFFLSKKFHDEYKTRNFFFCRKTFYECINIGVPSSIGIVFEMLGNYVMQMIIIKMLSEYISNHNIALNIFIFFSFFFNGLHKAMSGLAANIIGAREFELLHKLYKSGIIVHMLFSLVVFIPTVIFPSYTASFYTSDPLVIKYSIYTLPFVGIYYFFDGLGWTVSGITTAGGDTKFIMVANSVVIWGFKVLPLYILVYYDFKYISIGWIISAISSFIYAACFVYRYKSGKWLKLKLS